MHEFEDENELPGLEPLGLELDESALRPPPRASIPAYAMSSDAPTPYARSGVSESPAAPPRTNPPVPPRTSGVVVSTPSDDDGSFAKRVYVSAAIIAVVFAVLIGGRLLYRQLTLRADEPSAESYTIGKGLLTITGPTHMQECERERASGVRVEYDCKYSRREHVGVAVAALPIPPGANVSLDAIVHGMRSDVNASVTVSGERWTENGGQLIRQISGTVREADGMYEFETYVLVNRGRLILLIVEGKAPTTLERRNWMETMLGSIVVHH